MQCLRGGKWEAEGSLSHLCTCPSWAGAASRCCLESPHPEMGPLGPFAWHQRTGARLKISLGFSKLTEAQRWSVGLPEFTQQAGVRARIQTQSSLAQHWGKTLYFGRQEFSATVANCMHAHTLQDMVYRTPNLFQVTLTQAAGRAIWARMNETKCDGRTCFVLM